MRYHKMRGVPLEVCAAEQSIAYSMTWGMGEQTVKRFLYGDFYDEREIPAEIPAAVLDSAADYIADTYSRSPRRKKFVDVDALRVSVRAGIAGYLRNPANIAEEYDKIGAAFPKGAA